MKGHDSDNLWFFGIVVAVPIPLIPVSVHYAKQRARELTELAQQIGFQFLESKLNTPPSGPSTFLIHNRGVCVHQRLNWIGWRIPSQPVRLYLPHGKNHRRSNRRCFLRKVHDCLALNFVRKTLSTK
jgi:hypothetical protein